MHGDWVALAQVLMNMVPRDSLGSSQYYGDEDSDVSSFLSISILCKKLGNLHWFTPDIHCYCTADQGPLLAVSELHDQLCRCHGRRCSVCLVNTASCARAAGSGAGSRVAASLSMLQLKRGVSVEVKTAS